MRSRVRDVEGQRGLVEIAALDVDAGGFAAQRMPAIGADHEPCGQRLSLPGADIGMRIVGTDAFRLVIEPDQICKLGGALLERCHQHAVFDIVAECIEADLIATKT